MENTWPPGGRYSQKTFMEEAAPLMQGLHLRRTLDRARRWLYQGVGRIFYEQMSAGRRFSHAQRIQIRDCARILEGFFLSRSALTANFDIAAALWDVSRGIERADLQEGFWAELIHLVQGLQGRAPVLPIDEDDIFEELIGREAALRRSDDLDALWNRVEAKFSRYESGLTDEAISRRSRRRRRVLAYLGGTEADWADWTWHCRSVINSPEILARLINVPPDQVQRVKRMRDGRLPFGITPYYASLMDDDPDSGRDSAIRAQVLPPENYVGSMLKHRQQRDEKFDFMREHDTSPIDLVTRRYPGIVILKPFNSCPQICVYCQRNWEICEAMDWGALASEEAIEAAIQWITEHPAIREVLLTGGDPLVLDDARLAHILKQLAAIPHVDLIRIGSRTLVTMPMRITPELAAMLGSLRKIGRLEICVVTHYEHPYEITPESAVAVDRLRRQGIAVYNQHVYNFYVSRRFEAACLRFLLRRIGVDPYYTFAPKGKEEMSDYRVPIARLLQEQKEEARLLPGLRRTDEPVFNVPRLGKNHLRARQHRDLLSVQPNGSRIYEYHPWEKNIVDRTPFVCEDTPILDYLKRLAAYGEDPEDYQSIWYYY